MDHFGDSSQGGDSRTSAPSRTPEQADDGLSMNELNAALPAYNSSQRYPQQYAASATSLPYLQTQQLAGQASPSNFHPQYTPSYTPQMSPYGYPSPNRVAASSIQSQYPGQQMYTGQQPVYYQQYPQSPQYFQASPRQSEHMIGHGYQTPLSQGPVPAWTRFPADPLSQQRAIPTVPRGPPRKPKQSGHALWVGNLPPGALVNDLKDYFSRDATNDIESVFLISKSNCAFVNYKTEEACAAAMARFHDSRFSGVRLVCRLRRTSTTAQSPGIPIAPAALSSTAASAEGQTAIEAVTKNREESSKAEVANKSIAGADKINDKYFVVKSLTIEDLELSVRNGIWATQAHNEDTLNKAYESVENVFLIFSANKSGEYFGYARMASPINEESAATLDWKPRMEQPISDDPDLPRSIPTPATETAPKGRIIDDSARGTIFWEAEPASDDEAEAEVDGETEAETEAETHETSIADNRDESATAATSQQPYGHPFRIQWISTARLPFYRTRGLRNPWNSNREVKIARDGTELETSVGRRLVSLFAALQPGAVPSSGGGSGGSSGGPSRISPSQSGLFQQQYQQQQQGQQFQQSRY